MLKIVFQLTESEEIDMDLYQGTRASEDLSNSEVSPVDHTLGSPSASVILIEYGDFECPSCLQAYPAVKLLLETHGAKMRFVFRHFPLRETHPHAELAAEAAEAAGAQGKFWDMAALLFKNQLHLNAKTLRRCAEELELDMLRYDMEIDDHVYLQRVQEHMAYGEASGVRQTPAFFINGEIVDVSFSIEHLFKVVDEQIAERSNR
ncbi:MAG TPA: thioredoxin domain-containing protein [Rhodocyclaceae bacterium]|nr:thioredoxin domain-containing protein [Rhodocyclaceae bacterium]